MSLDSSILDNTGPKINARKTYFLFLNIHENHTGIWSLLGKIAFFSTIWSSSLDGKWKNSLSEKNSWNFDIFCIFGNDGIFYPTSMISRFLPEEQRWSSPEKNRLKNMTFLVSLDKMIFILKDMVFLLIEKFRMINKFYAYKKVPMILCTFMETFISIFIFCFPMKKTQII